MARVEQWRSPWGAIILGAKWRRAEEAVSVAVRVAGSAASDAAVTRLEATEGVLGPADFGETLVVWG